MRFVRAEWIKQTLDSFLRSERKETRLKTQWEFMLQCHSRDKGRDDVWRVSFKRLLGLIGATSAQLVFGCTRIYCVGLLAELWQRNIMKVGTWLHFFFFLSFLPFASLSASRFFFENFRQPFWITLAAWFWRISSSLISISRRSYSAFSRISCS